MPALRRARQSASSRCQRRSALARGERQSPPAADMAQAGAAPPPHRECAAPRGSCPGPSSTVLLIERHEPALAIDPGPAARRAGASAPATPTPRRRRASACAAAAPAGLPLQSSPRTSRSSQPRSLVEDQVDARSSSDARPAVRRRPARDRGSGRRRSCAWRAPPLRHRRFADQECPGDLRSLRPPSSFSVSATRAGRPSAGWQQMNIAAAGRRLSSSSAGPVLLRIEPRELGLRPMAVARSATGDARRAVTGSTRARDAGALATSRRLPRTRPEPRLRQAGSRRGAGSASPGRLLAARETPARRWRPDRQSHLLRHVRRPPSVAPRSDPSLRLVGRHRPRRHVPDRPDLDRPVFDVRHPRRARQRRVESSHSIW